MSNSKPIQDKIQDVFVACSNRSGETTGGTCDLQGVVSVFWAAMNNSLSLVDISGVFAMAGSKSHIDSNLFYEFFSGVARVKYPTGLDFREKMLEDIANAKSIRLSLDNPSFLKAIDKNTVKVLLRFDLPLRRCFSSFAGHSVNVGAGLTWEEVKKMSVGMEVDGFIAFASSHSLIPASLSAQQCELIANDILKSFPQLAAAVTLNSALLYPQFQLLLCFIAMEKYDTSNKRAASSKAETKFAKKVVEVEVKPMADMLLELLKSMGIDKSNSATSSSLATATLPSSPSETRMAGSFGVTKGSLKDSADFDGSNSSSNDTNNNNNNSGLIGNVIMPLSERPEDHYSSSMNHGRQAMLLRMEHLFDEIETKLLNTIDSGSDVMELLSTQPDEVFDTKSRLASKPVVIGDAVPVPQSCPEVVEQLLQAALAHHNLGSFEDSLKFLEAARLQLTEIERRIRKARLREQNETAAQIVSLGGTQKKSENNEEINQNQNNQQEDVGATHFDSSGLLAGTLELPLDLDMYIMICKGNVYQSCGDDEQSLLQYMEAWSRASASENKDWELVCLNSIGILAYYSLRYDVAFMSFTLVSNFRAKEYGLNSADTATAWNNEACCLFCMNKRRESRVRFERSWNVTCKALGHRAPRSVTVWKNLEKARRANASLQSKELKESIDMRPDADRLLVGGTFTIKATAPPETLKKKKGGGKGGGKKKKK